MWGQAQKNTIAKQIIDLEFRRGAACSFLTGKMREAIVESVVFGVVRAQASGTVEVEAMDDLLEGVKAAVQERLGIGFFE